MKIRLIIFVSFFNFTFCRDFIVGMFKKNDFLVASDTFYKEVTSRYGYTTANYGRMFHCPITYFRVSDRLGVGRSPRIQITRGGLQKKFIHVRMTASYGQPIAVNIYVGCKNDLTTTKPTTTTVTGETTRSAGNETASEAGDTPEGGETTVEGEAATEAGDTPVAEGEADPAAEEAAPAPAEGGDENPPVEGEAAEGEEAPAEPEAPAGD